MEYQNSSTLLFVYNADNGWQNVIIDGVHKILSPKTYPCKLCEITHGFFSEKKKWKDFLNHYDRKIEFLHRDQFKKQYASKFGYKFEFPIVLLEERGELQVFISTEELNQLGDSEDLIQFIKNRDSGSKSAE